MHEQLRCDCGADVIPDVQLMLMSATSVLITPSGGLGTVLMFLQPGASAIVFNFYQDHSKHTEQQENIYYWCAWQAVPLLCKHGCHRAQTMKKQQLIRHAMPVWIAKTSADDMVVSGLTMGVSNALWHRCPHLCFTTWQCVDSSFKSSAHRPVHAGTWSMWTWRYTP